MFFVSYLFPLYLVNLFVFTQSKLSFREKNQTYIEASLRYPHSRDRKHLLLINVGWLLHWDYLLFSAKTLRSYTEVGMLAPVIKYELRKNKLWKLHSYSFYGYWHKPPNVCNNFQQKQLNLNRPVTLWAAAKLPCTQYTVAVTTSWIYTLIYSTDAILL